jgi:hypothetical protein
MLLTFFIALFSLVGLYLFAHHRHQTDKGANRRNRKSRKSASTVNNVQNESFHCVETHYHAHCCYAVKELHGKRFLSAQAPSLPVKNCDQAHCHCDYIHHDDRRTDVRRDGIGLQHHMYGQNGEAEHRHAHHHGRRETD